MFASHEDFVRATYGVLLGRDPEPAGLEHWSQMIAAGFSRDAVVQEVLSSEEYAYRAGASGDPRRCADVDLLIPVKGFELRAPACDRSLVPALLNDRVWGPHILAYLREHLHRDHVFMDIGANLGYFTVLCAPLAARIIAFEPLARVRAYCVDNVTRNRLGNVQVLGVGLWHETVRTGIRYDTGDLGGGSLSAPGEEPIVCHALDDLVAEGLELARLDMVKMDIQGAEVSALLGMRRTIERHRPQIILEVDRVCLKRLGRSVAELWRPLVGFGYRLAAFQPWEVRVPDALESLDALERRGPMVDVVALPG